MWYILDSGSGGLILMGVGPGQGPEQRDGSESHDTGVIGPLTVLDHSV